MRGLAARLVGLAAIYLLVLTSVEPGDLLVGVAIAGGVLALLHPRRAGHAGMRTPPRLRAAVVVLARTGWEMVRGSWQTARFCLGWQAHPGLVEIPRGERSRAAVALWGVLTGEAPDEVVVDVDEERDVLIVHVLEASDPEAVRERHRHAHEHGQRQVAP